MAILINDIIQAIGSDVITIEDADSNQLEPGIHILNAERSILGNTFSQWTIITSYDQGAKITRAQVWVPMTANQDTVGFFFVRTASTAGNWNSFKKYVAGDKLITLTDFASNVFSLVDNTDPLNPKIKQDATKADKVTGNFTPNSIAAIDANGNLISTERQFDWVNYYTIEYTEAYLLELMFAKAYDDTEPAAATYKGFAYAVITPSDIKYQIKDRTGATVTPTQVRFDNWRAITIGSNSLSYITTTADASTYTGIPANAVVFNGAKDYVANESTTYTGSAFVDIVWEFQVDNENYVERRTLKILGVFGKQNVWLEQGTGTKKYRIEGTYVDPSTNDNPQFYSSDQVDNLINRITIPGNHEGQIMVFGTPSVAGDIYRWLDVATTMAAENQRTDTRILTEKAVGAYVDSRITGQGVSGFEYTQNNRRLVITKADTTSLYAELPLATTSIDGLMAKEDKAQIAALVSDVAMLAGKARLVGNIGASATESDIQTFWESVKGSSIPADVMVGSIVVNLDQDPPTGHSWMYVQLGDGTYHWIDKGSDSAPTATNTSLGIVKGVAPGTGYNYHCNFINQVGNGLPYLTETLTNTVDPTFTITITGVDGAGNITGYTMTPTTGATSKFLSRVEFTNSNVGDAIFRFDITSFAAGQGEGYSSVNAAGELYTNGYQTLREQVEYQLDNKVDKQGINIWSTDGFIKVEGESPNFAIGLNVAGSTEMVDLTSIIDGTTTQWDLCDYDSENKIKGDVKFWYGDGRLIPGKDYTFNINKNQQGEITSKDLVCLNDPAWNASENRTLYCEITKTALISDITGIANITSSDGSILYQKQGESVNLQVNDRQIFSNETQTITTPTESQTIISSGTIMDFLQSLSNNVKFLMDNTVWKNSNQDLPLKIAFQTSAVTPEAGVNKIQIDPNDLGQN